jgi:Methyltransferase domain
MKPSASSFSSLVPGLQPKQRVVEPEWLDELPSNDPQALRSRRDLRRLNRLMGHAAVVNSVLTTRLERPPRTIAEIGAGDGTLMLKLAARMHVRWPRVHLRLVDHQNVTTNETLERFRGMGWQTEAVTADAFDWLAAETNSADVILANLFLHHFEDARLRELFRSLAQRTNLLVACETRREWLSATASRLLGFLNCNPVTRHDALISVKAGFVNNELSALWPRDDWQLTERRAGCFTHLFVAERKN